MSLKTAARTAQNVMQAEFSFNHDDTMVDVAGVTKDFGVSQLTSSVFDVIGLPPGSVVVGGEVITETAFDTAGYDITIGDSSDADRYLASVDRAAAGRSALTPTGFHNTDGLPLRFTFASDDVCTAGKMTIRVQYTVDGRANEVM